MVGTPIFLIGDACLKQAVRRDMEKQRFRRAEEIRAALSLKAEELTKGEGTCGEVQADLSALAMTLTDPWRGGPPHVAVDQGKVLVVFRDYVSHDTYDPANGFNSKGRVAWSVGRCRVSPQSSEW